MDRSCTACETAPGDRLLIVGAGMAGSLLALTLGRAGREVVVFDQRRDPAPTFRSEKLDLKQIALLNKLGALAPFEAGCWPAGAYPGGERPGLADCGAAHHTWLAGVRAAWPDGVRLVVGTVEALTCSNDVQSVHTSAGQAWTGRLAVLATGRAPALRKSLGVRTRTLSAGHSICFGFSVDPARPIAAKVLAGPAGSGLGYVSLFPMPDAVRVNVFSYRALADPWTRWMRADPISALADLVPETIALLQGARLVKRCEARATDLYAVGGHRRDGLVLIGDAFHAACPASGTGLLRILNDVDRLTHIHIPRWLATSGMGRDKIAQFYADPIKRRIDRASLDLSYRGRGGAVGLGPYWLIPAA